MSWITITPTDVLLFRDGKPFSAGADHSANSMFPPTPMTVQGAMRAKISMDQGVSFGEYKSGKSERAKKASMYIGPYGKTIDTGAFSMRGPFICLAIDEKKCIPLLPMPADLLVLDNKKAEGEQFIITGPSMQSQFVSDMEGISTFPNVHPGYENKQGLWLTADAFNNYLNGIVPSEEHMTPDDDEQKAEGDCEQQHNPSQAYGEGKRVFPSGWLFSSDYRFGVSTDAVKSFREDGQLYQIAFVRMSNGVSLLVDVNGIPQEDLIKSPEMTIGGEQGRASAATVNLAEAITRPPTTISGRFKVILLTPTYFSSGWKPKEWSRIFSGVDPNFITAALYRPQYIGGWNTAAGAARAMHAYAAPGSVYYFDTGGEEIKLPDTFTETPDGIMDAGKLGFGQYIVAAW